MGTNGIGRTRQPGPPPEPTTSEYGVLGAARDFQVERHQPAPDLAELVERYWVVTWNLPPDRHATATVLPHPAVNLVLDRGQLAVHGVPQDLFEYPLAGSGRVFGVKFRPGGFLPFLRRPVAELTTPVPATALWGDDAAGLARDLSADPDTDRRIRLAETFLRRHWPDPDPNVALVGQVVRALLYDRSTTRVEDVTHRCQLSARSLQRLFRRYVGVSPKWVLNRYRLHEAAARLAEGTGGGWAQIAVELGYFDQSHFIRDFTRVIGTTPTRYAAACAEGRVPLSA